MDKKQKILDLTDESDLRTLLESPELLSHYLSKVLKLPSPIVKFFTLEGEGQDIPTILKDAFEVKTGTSSLYMEVGEVEGKTVYSNIHPYYAKHPLTIDEWRELIEEQIEYSCPHIVAVDDGEYIYEEASTNKVIYKQYRFRKRPDCGYVLRHSCSDSATTARLYTEKDGVVYYLPSKVYNKSSGRYNKVTDSYYPESIKMLLLSMGSDNLEDLVNTIFILREELITSKTLSLEEVQTIITRCKGQAPAPLQEEYESLVSSADEEKLNDLLWRCTNFTLTVGDILKLFEKGTPKNPEIREFLGTLLCTPVMSERLYKE